MIKMDLQHFAEAISGKDIVYLYRIKSKAATEDASHLAYTSENSRTISVDSDSTATKDGSIRTPGVAEVEISATAYLRSGDELLDQLEDAMVSGETMEVWEANLKEPGTATDTFKGKYFQGLLTEFEKTSSAEEFVECSLTFGINGSGKRGDVPVTAEQQEEASYVFTDTKKTGA